METEIWKEWKIKDIDKVLQKIRSKSPTRPMYFGIYVHNEWLQRLIKRNQDPSMGYAGVFTLSLRYETYSYKQNTA